MAFRVRSETKSMATKVLIVDDHPATCEGLSIRIAGQPDLEVCGEAADVAEALKLIEQTHPDVAVVDIQLKTGNGLELIERIKACHSSIRVLAWSMYADAIYAERALHAGALGYINKQNTTGRILEAIRCVRDGRIYLCEEMTQQMLTQTVSGTKPRPAAGPECLTNRELEVFQLVGQGLSTFDIATRLHRSVHTVESHREKIKRKLNLRNATELQRAAVQWVLQNG
jgi:DNA-binding NarL/FixJ family response regulator